MAVLFGVVGFFDNPILLFVAVFVFIGAGQEAQAVQAKSLLRGITVAQAMISQFRVLGANDPVATAVQALLAGDQKDFPVHANGPTIGMLSRDDLLRALAQGHADDVVGNVMTPSCEVVHPHDLVDAVFTRMQQTARHALPVVHAGEIVGLITLENIAEWLMIAGTTRTQRP